MPLSGIVSSSENALCKQGKVEEILPRNSLPSTSLAPCKGFPRADEAESSCLKSLVNLSRVINPIAQMAHWICKDSVTFHRPFSARMKYSVLYNSIVSKL